MYSKWNIRNWPVTYKVFFVHKNFLINGWTNAFFFFNWTGEIPCSIDEFTDERSLIHSLRRHVGIGSYLQVAFYNFKIISLSPLQYKGWNLKEYLNNFSRIDVDLMCIFSYPNQTLDFWFCYWKSYQIYLECQVSFHIQGGICLSFAH
jgi:hypothetical protein